MTSDDIDATAATWVARMDRRELSEKDRTTLEAWLAKDRRHRGALARAQAVFVRFDRASALGTAFDHRRFLTHLPAIRSTWRHWAAAAMAASVALCIWIVLARGPTQAFSTARGEVRLVPLADGSAVTLNTQSRLAVDYSKAERRIELVSGEALFNVAKDRTRPFVVRVGNARVCAVGTSFSVRKFPDERIKVVVREGTVEVMEDAGGAASPIRVNADSEFVVRPQLRPALQPRPQTELSEPVAVHPTQIDRELAWQQGMISLDGRTLREAAAEFARYNATRIVFDDPAIADRTVTGLFSANNPVGFANAVAASMNFTLSVEGETLRIGH